MTDEQPTDAPVEDAPVDEAPVDGASVDGASVDGALDDGASVDGALNEGASVDGALDEGASVDGALDEGASVDGALVEGTPAADASGVGDGPTFYRYLTFNAPLSTRRADAIVDRLSAAARGDVLDVGCGWGELLLRLVAAVPGCTGTGVDIDRAALSRGRAAAAERGLADRVSFRDVSFRDVSFRDQPDGDGYSPADVVICVGSSHVFGDLTEALVALRGIVRPGGRLLFGEAYWEPHAPGDRSLIWDDVLALPDLGELVDLAVDAGFRPLYIEVSDRDELDAFESGFLADSEEWLMTHPDHAGADAVRARADEHRRRWLHGYRAGFGFAFLTLGVPVGSSPPTRPPTRPTTRPTTRPPMDAPAAPAS